MSLQPIQVQMTVEPSEQTVQMGLGAEVNPIINRNYNALDNKPSINGVTLQGDMTSADLHIDRTFVYEQNSAAAVWSITHNLNKFPSVSVVDSAGTVCVGEVTYLDENSLTCTFTAPFSGKAYLN